MASLFRSSGLRSLIGVQRQISSTTARRWLSASASVGRQTVGTVNRDMMTGEMITLPDLDVSPCWFVVKQTASTDKGLLIRIQASIVQVERTTTPKKVLPSSQLRFGQTFTDHMIT